MRKIFNTLYVMTPSAYVHLENDIARVDVAHKKKFRCRCTTLAARILPVS